MPTAPLLFPCRVLQPVWLRQRSVHLGAPVGKTVNLVLAGNADVVLVAGPLHVDIQIEHFFVTAGSRRERIAQGIAGPAAADEAKPPLRSHPIDREIIDAVFERPRVDATGGGALGSRWPVGRQNDYVGSEQGQRASCLRESRVVADIHSDA